ncbi:chemotaxis protein [Clostridiaceae bacterium HSG29]|nr:chemotaxis protein [Clostridiaceae bacterium HSG29]
MAEKSEILLESGTGEVEVLHFKVDGENYAINVVKVKEILAIDNISKVPNAAKDIAGVSLIRGEIITVIDMRYVINKQLMPNIEKSMNLVCEFNKLKVSFAIDQVVGISRIKWSDISKPDDVTSNSLVIGNINHNGTILMLLDFEKIVMDISPKTGINVSRIENVEKKDRSNYKIVLADDSPLIRNVLKEVLELAGFKNMTFFDNGQDTYDFLMNLVNKKGENFTDDIDLLITDIEMPRLDGHALTRRLKENRITKKLPILIFSSLITDDLYHKGESVGADGQMSKPEIDNLINMVDKLLEG